MLRACLRLSLHLLAARNHGRCPTRLPPTVITGRPFSPTPVNTRQQSSLPAAVHSGQWRGSKDCKSNPLGASFPECTCVPSACVGLCARVCGPVRVGSVSVQILRLGPGVGIPPLLIPTTRFARQESLLRSLDVREARVPTPPPVPPLTQCHLRRHSSSCPALVPVRAPSCRGSAGSQGSSWLRAPARSGLVERGGAAEAAPPTQGREWSAQHPFSSQPSTQPSSNATVAGGCPLASDFTAYRFGFQPRDGASCT